MEGLYVNWYYVNSVSFFHKLNENCTIFTDEPRVSVRGLCACSFYWYLTIS